MENFPLKLLLPEYFSGHTNADIKQTFVILDAAGKIFSHYFSSEWYIEKRDEGEMALR